VDLRRACGVVRHLSKSPWKYYTAQRALFIVIYALLEVERDWRYAVVGVFFAHWLPCTFLVLFPNCIGWLSCGRYLSDSYTVVHTIFNIILIIRATSWYDEIQFVIVYVSFLSHACVFDKLFAYFCSLPRIQHFIESQATVMIIRRIIVGSIHIKTQGVTQAWLSPLTRGSSAQCPAWHDWHQQQRATSPSSTLSTAGSQRSQHNVWVSLRRSRLCDLKPKTIGGGREGERVSAIPRCVVQFKDNSK